MIERTQTMTERRWNDYREEAEQRQSGQIATTETMQNDDRDYKITMTGEERRWHDDREDKAQ